MANQLENLKKINEMQKEGVLLEFLRDIRSLKSDLDNLSSQFNVRKNQIHKDNESKKAEIDAKKKLEEKKIEAKNFIDENKKENGNKSDQDYAFQQTNSYQHRSFNQNGQGEKNYSNQNRSYNQNGQQRSFNSNTQRPYNQNGQQRQYDPNGQQRQYNPNGQQRPFNPNGQQRPFNQNGQRPYNPNGQQRPFNPNGQRPYNQNGQQRPFNPNGQNNGFVSTRANSFRKFEKDIPDTNIVQVERNFGNKNKNPDRNKTTPEERKTQTRKGSDNKNSFISLDGNFEEVTMGSRKVFKNKKKTDVYIAPAISKVVLTSKFMLVKELSEKTKKSVAEIVKQLMILGIMANINSSIDVETAELVCGELGIEVEVKFDKTMEEKLEEASSHDASKNTEKRPPIVTVMGHVDHGKTSLLDAFRNTNVVTSEAGGITQSIGAYQITFNKEKITFIDTPGHAAFTAMRARGAKATDIAILVVAADDGIMPQTVEAINHIKAAKVPMIVAINKMDKPTANPEKIKQQLADHDVLPEEWGGDAIIVPCSALRGDGLDKLKETILLIAEMEEYKADSSSRATGIVIEANLDKGRGPVANIIVQNGTLKVGDSIICGITFGKVRAMFDEKGKAIKTAPPSMPVSILGLNEVPSSGDTIYVVEESLSKQVIQERITKIKAERSAQTSGATLDDFMQRVQEGNLKNLNIILKADTQGSVEAITATLMTIRNEEAKINIVHKGVGAVTESDVILADATGSVIIAFNQKPVPKARQLAENVKIEIKEYKIIYEIIDDLTKAISGMLSVKYEEKYIGKAEVLIAFKLSSVGKVAGSMIKDGKATRNCIVKVLRGEEEIGVSTIDSLKIVKDEKAEVLKGFECGIKLKDNIDFKEGDTLEFYVKEVVKRG